MNRPKVTVNLIDLRNHWAWDKDGKADFKIKSMVNMTDYKIDAILPKRIVDLFIKQGFTVNVK